MNGGLCERLFDLAKQQLDARDDPERPTVELGAEDLIAACRALPPPPDRGASPRLEAKPSATEASPSAVALQVSLSRCASGVRREREEEDTMSVRF